MVGSVRASRDPNARLRHWALLSKESVRIFERTCLKLYLEAGRPNCGRDFVPSWTWVGDQVFPEIWQLTDCM